MAGIASRDDVVICELVLVEVYLLIRNQAVFERRRVIDLRLGLTLAAAGVTGFATRNVSDFEGLGIARVFGPLQRATVLKQL